jgi:putative transposase
VKRRFTEEQIIGFLKQAEAGVAVKELCRKHGFSDASFYTWRAKYGGMNVSEARRLRELENAKLKKLLAESLLDAEALKSAPNAAANASHALGRSPARYLRAALLARIYEIFPLRCALCGADMRIIAFVIDAPAVNTILAHLGEPTRHPASGSGAWSSLVGAGASAPMG